MRTAEAMEVDEDERALLQTWVHRGHAAAARIQTRARILVKLAAGWRDVAIARAVDVDVGVGTVSNTRQRFLAGGLEGVRHDKAQGRHRQALCGEQSAHLIAIACSPAPTGHDHWTLRLLAGKAVEVGCVPRISPETIRHARQQTSASPGSLSRGASRQGARRLSRRGKRSSTSPPKPPIRRSR